MIRKFMTVNEHKGFGIVITETPVFSCTFEQFFVENMEDFKKGVPNGSDCSVRMGIDLNEFTALAGEILAYQKELVSSSDAMKKFVEKEK